MKHMSLLISLFILFLLTLSAAAQEVHVCFLFLDFPEENFSSGLLTKWEDGVTTPVIDNVFAYARAGNTEMYYARKQDEGYQILDDSNVVLFESLNEFGGMSASSGTVVWSDVFVQDGSPTSIVFSYQVEINRVQSLPDYDGAIMPLMTDGQLYYVKDNYLVFPENFLLSSMYSPTGFQSFDVDPLGAFVVYTHERQLMARQHNETDAIEVKLEGVEYVDEVSWFNAFTLIFSGEDESGTQGIWLLRLPDGNNRHERELQAIYQSPEGQTAVQPSYCQSEFVND